MPNWNAPLLPQSAIQPAQDYLERPSLTQSPTMARIKGFGSGALQGLRNLTTPTSLAGLAGLALSGGASEAPAAASAISDLTNITPDLVEAGPAIRQVAPSVGDTDALLGQLKYNLAKVPSAGARGAQGAVQGLQSAAPTAEMVPQGGEAAFNAVRAAKQAARGSIAPELPSPYNFGRIPILQR